VLAALKPQVSSGVEVLLVDSSGPERAAELEREHPWARIIALPARTLPGKARNIGARAAHGRHLAFIDADAVPASQWLAELGARLEGTAAAAVAGAVRNGTPNNPIGTSSYLLEFSELMPTAKRAPLHAASCNMLVDRGAFEAAGGFCEDVWPGEDTILTFPWGRTNRLLFAADAAVWHLNRTRLAELLRHQHRLGRSFVAVCDRVKPPYRRFSRWPLLALAPVLRLGTLGTRLWDEPTLLRNAGRVSHLLAAGLAAWTAGVADERRRLKSPKRSSN